MQQRAQNKKHHMGHRMREGQTLLEVLLAIGFGTLMIITAVGAIVPAVRMLTEAERRQTAASLGRELLEHVQVYAQADWHNVNGLATSSANKYYISATSSPFSVQSGIENIVVASTTYTRSFYLDDVERDANGDVVDSGGTIDPSTMEVVITYGQGSFSSVASSYISRSKNNVYVQTDWSNGACQSGPLDYVNAEYASSANVLFASTTGAFILALNGETNPTKPYPGSPDLNLVASSTSNPASGPQSDIAYSVILDADYLYVGGFKGDGDFYYEKRNLDDLAIVASTTSNPGGIDRVYDMAMDSTHLYAVGVMSNLNWYVEKRQLSDLSLSASTSSNPGSLDRAFGVAIDSTYMYIVGDENNMGEWRIEKRNLSDLAIVASTTSNPGTDDIAYAVVIDATYLYVVGYEEIASATNIRIEKRNLSNLAIVASTSLSIAGNDVAYDVASDGTYLYTAGTQSNAGAWHIGKFDMSDLSLTASTSSDVGGSGDFAQAIAIDDTYMYIGGYASNTDWHIEKRQLSDLVLTASTSSNPGAGDEIHGIAVSDTYLYAVGMEDDADWRIEQYAQFCNLQ